MKQKLLETCPLFRGAQPEQIAELLESLSARERSYGRGETILRAGEVTDAVCVVMAGGVTIENDDAWGNRAILEHLGPGQVFAEAYACLPGEPLMVTARAAEDSRILFLRVEGLLRGSADGSRALLVRNLLDIAARKNLALSRRIFHTSAKTIRGRLRSYLSEQAVRHGSRSFTIPFDRQQLADYLGVDRSALSAELGKMQREGLLRVDRRRFELPEE
ncbi:MAG: Crp/Fnr family transcriptional regulator [Oscillospiraceae bacterium]|nr:Crp/Fnr family transcriptional regulator [Oscillospiraceae bacterium]